MAALLRPIVLRAVAALGLFNGWATFIYAVVSIGSQVFVGRTVEVAAVGGVGIALVAGAHIIAVVRIGLYRIIVIVIVGRCRILSIAR